MYVNPQNGQAAAATATPAPHLGTFRRNILAVVVGNKLFTAEEQLKTNDSVYQTECPYKLALWLKNVRRVAAEREHTQGLARLAEGLERGKELLAQPAAPTTPQWATASQCDEVFALASLPCFTAGEKKAALQGLVTLTQVAAVQEIGRLYATAWRRGLMPLFADGSTRQAA